MYSSIPPLLETTDFAVKCSTISGTGISWHYYNNVTLVLFIEKAVSLKASCVLEDESMAQMGNISIFAIRLRVAQNIFNSILAPALIGDLSA